MRILFSLYLLSISLNCNSTSFTVKLGSQITLLFSLVSGTQVENTIHQTDNGILFSTQTTIGLFISNHFPNTEFHELMNYSEPPIIDSVISTGLPLQSSTILYLRSLNWMPFVIAILERFHEYFEKVDSQNKHRLAVIAEGLEVKLLNSSLPVARLIELGATNVLKPYFSEKQTDF